MLMIFLAVRRDSWQEILHKESTNLVRENQLIAVENLKVKNMLRNHKLSKAISDVSWAEFSVCWNTRPSYMAVMW